jgi:hypothetical protein
VSPAGSSNAHEARARTRIDQALTEAGWTLQDRDDMNLAASSAVAVREFKLARGHGYVDYMLFLPSSKGGRAVVFLPSLFSDEPSRAAGADWPDDWHGDSTHCPSPN